MVARPLRRALLISGCVLGVGCSLELTTTVHGSGTARSELRAVEPFARLEVRGGLECEVEVGAGVILVTVHGDENLLALVETQVIDGELIVGTADGYRLEPAPLIEVQLPSLSALTQRGSGRVRVEGLGGEAFDLLQQGSGLVTLAGAVERLEVVRQGSGEADLAALSAGQVLVRSQGSGYVYVNPRSSLEVDLAGSGDVIYRGSPTVSAKTRGSGDVRQISD
jgi:Putative auto-transporter adhesin, head GIN domain